MKTITEVVVALMFLAGFASTAESAAEPTILVCMGGTVYPSPTAAPVKDAAVLAEDGKVTMVGAGVRFKLPSMERVSRSFSPKYRSRISCDTSANGFSGDVDRVDGADVGLASTFADAVMGSPRRR